MSFIRVNGSNYTVQLGELESCKVVHSTGNYSVRNKRNEWSKVADTPASGVSLPSGYGTIDISTLKGFINGTEYTLDTSLVPGTAFFPQTYQVNDVVKLTFFSTTNNSIISIGSGTKDFALKHGDVIVPGSSIVSLEKT